MEVEREAKPRDMVRAEDSKIDGGPGYSMNDDELWLLWDSVAGGDATAVSRLVCAAKDTVLRVPVVYPGLRDVVSMLVTECGARWLAVDGVSMLGWLLESQPLEAIVLCMAMEYLYWETCRRGDRAVAVLSALVSASAICALSGWMTCEVRLWALSQGRESWSVALAVVEVLGDWERGGLEGGAICHVFVV